MRENKRPNPLGTYQSIFKGPMGFFAVEVTYCKTEVQCEERAKQFIQKRLESAEYSLYRTVQISEYTDKMGNEEDGYAASIINNIKSPVIDGAPGYNRIIEDLKGLTVTSKEDVQLESGTDIRMGDKGVITGGAVIEGKLKLEVKINGLDVEGDPYLWDWLQIIWPAEEVGAEEWKVHTN